MDLIFQGMTLGLVLACSIGPIFFALVQTSIREGLEAGLFVATGIWVSDFLFVLFTYLGLSQMATLLDHPAFQSAFNWTGGGFMMAFGLVLFFKKPAPLQHLEGKPQRGSSIAWLWLQGFLVNTANPFTILFWLTLMTDGVMNRSFGTAEVLLFFGAILGTIIVTDFLKAYFADRIRHKLRRPHLQWLNWISGVVVMGFGLAILLR